MQILIPMSGNGSRFSAAGYDKPKPLIEFFGKPMIEHVLENLGVDNEFVLCVKQDHYDSDPALFAKLATMVNKLSIMLVEKVTQGAAETCVMAQQYLDMDKPLFIANCDQMMTWDQAEFEQWFEHKQLDGAMFVFDSDSTKNSYVEIDGNGIAIRTAEKQVISPYATTGIYVWKRTGDFMWAAKKMIGDNIRVNNEFYVCPVYNENIARGDRIGIYTPPKHWPIGTPEDLDIYIEANR
jgi:NDP-sugar pyrophosphorylase family protein